MRVSTLISFVACAGLLSACGSSNDPPAPTTYSASMNGANERPNPVTTTATGTFTATLGANDVLTYSLSFTGLTSNSNNAHIHGPLPTTTATAGVLINFNDAAAGRTITLGATSGTGQGTIDLKVAPNANVSADSLKKLFNTGKLYVNVHSVNNGGGEILGIITKP